MAGLLNNILDYMRFNDDDDYYYDEEEEVKAESVVSTPSRAEATTERKKFSKRRHEEEEEVETSARRERSVRTERSASKVVPMRGVSSKSLEVCIVKPTSFEDSQQVCDILLEGRACVVNLEGFDADEAQRIMDFISGCIFAINGKLHRIAKYIFIFAPENIDISGDYLDLLPEDKKNSMTINKDI